MYGVESSIGGGYEQYCFIPSTYTGHRAKHYRCILRTNIASRRYYLEAMQRSPEILIYSLIYLNSIAPKNRG